VELAAYAAAIYRELCASAVQVVQSTSIRTTYAASLAIFAYTLRHPCAAEPALITTLHGGKQHDIYAEARRHLRMLGDAVIVVSETGRAALAQDDDHHHHAARANRVHVVAPGRDLRAFVEVAQGRVAPAVLDRVPQDARVVLHAGRLAPLKGQRYLLEAWALAKPKLDGAVLVIAGSGELADDLRQQATELGVADSVVFAGFRSDLPALLARADLFALSSLWEGLPMAAVEAMAAERPIVATRAGGTPDVVADGETGLLVPPADPAALAQALTRVLGDAALRGRLAQAGGRRVAQTYTREALVTATLAVYQLAWARRQRFNHQLLMSYEV
jgi:glycosyltransferase involved in cell wall biosynthesis